MIENEPEARAQENSKEVKEGPFHINGPGVMARTFACAALMAVASPAPISAKTSAFERGTIDLGERNDPNQIEVARAYKSKREAVHFTDGSLYVGTVYNDKPHGTGRFVFEDGSMYIGEVREGEPHGKGTFFWPSGSKYTGEFRNGKMNGEGKLIVKNREIFEGTFNDDEIVYGKHWAPSKGHYEGHFRNGMRHGSGTVILFDGKKFIGLFSNGIRKEGRWIESTAPKVVFGLRRRLTLDETGECDVETDDDGNANGYGECLMLNGMVYRGGFVDNKPNGYGTTRTRFGGPSDDHGYSGEFRNGVPHGYGVGVYVDGKYVGGIRNGKHHGIGTVIFRDGRRFDGRFRGGDPTSDGEWTTSD